ncbi:MAG: hypothetical protein AB4372_13970 [Xenococcus sp. (in: cyanobacteria)]
MTNPTIEIDLGEILGEIRQDLKQLSSNVSDLKVGQARLEEKVNNLEKDHNEFKESTRKNFDDFKESTRRNFDELKELIEKNNNETKESIKELKNAQETLAADVADLKGAKSLIIPIVVAVTTAVLTLVARTIPLG